MFPFKKKILLNFRLGDVRHEKMSLVITPMGVVAIQGMVGLFFFITHWQLNKTTVIMQIIFWILFIYICYFDLND